MSWDVDDRNKVIATLFEEGSRCQMCGTAEWEWKADRYAYHSALHVCLGCQNIELSSEDQDTAPGGKMVLIPRGK